MPKSVRDSGDSDEKVDPFQVVVEALLVREDTTGRFQHGHWRGEQGRKLKTEYGGDAVWWRMIYFTKDSC